MGSHSQILCLSVPFSWLITAPNLIHVGVEETVSIQIHGATQPVVVTLFFKHPYVVDEILSSTEHVTLSGENRFQTVVKLKLSWKLSFDF